ncbi:DUF1684 domain-containing protein [Leucobacter sp. UCMA 4100]|uniref:DUF1684 domain-containing protein n=1 Tax=Leucobacter sp. UCMA 4100 TaxID=2810534 RepID=UPI0022EA7E53|nr:DUF1684 domain-containing protein [Leucobacter sp. UCMA 4100]MDA3146959.1 DUF1684 domain-containing protein [Leucobacter sp. UCMA 4100]
MSDSVLSAAIEQSREGHDAWHSERAAAVTGPTGNLALVETRWFGAGETVDVEAEQASAPEGVTVTSLARRSLSTGEAEHGLRRWDANSAAIRAFNGISAFAFNPDWVIAANFTPVSADRTVPFEHIRDNGGTRELVVPGDITFTLNDVEYRFAAFDDGGVLLLVFGDATNGAEGADATYGAGRFLFVERPDGGSDAEAGTVILDFNRAFVPPCGFSAQYNCPMPPAQNRFALPVHAGEKQVLFAEGFDLYAA